MSLVLIPLVPLLSALLLLDYQSRETRSASARYVSLGSGILSLSLVSYVFFVMTPDGFFEHQFSPLFNLPGMPETLTLSLFADAVSIRWLMLMTIFSSALYALDFSRRFVHEPVNLSALHLAQAGLTILFLAGSLPASAVGWVIVLVAVLFATNDAESGSSENLSSSFTVLMASVFIMVAASLLLYAITGRLAFSNSPDAYRHLIQNIILHSPGLVATNVLNLTAFLLLITVLPGLGLVPFSSWLSKTREMHSINALFIYVNVLPAAVIILERYNWLFGFTPAIRVFALTVSLISITTAYVAIFSQTGTRLTMLWLAITCSGLLLSTVFFAESLPVPFILLTIYPGLFLFGFGRILEFVFGHPTGRLIQGLGIVVPVITAVFYWSINPHSPYRVGIPVLLIYVIPAVRIFRSSSAQKTDDAAFSSSLGWSAYRFFGIQTLTYYMIVKPVEHLAEGFLVLESWISFFLSHTFSRWVCFFGQMLCYFDRIVVDGSMRWLKKKQSHKQSGVNRRTDTGLLFIFCCMSIIRALLEGNVL